METLKNHWTTYLGPSSFPRSGHLSLAYKDSRMYVIGGMNNSKILNDIQCLDLDSMTWELISSKSADFPGRCSHAGVIDELSGLIYVYGGTGEKFGQSNRSDLCVFNINSKRWVPIKAKGKVPKARYGHSAVLYGHHIIFFGGTTGDKFLNDVFKFDLNLQKWESIEVRGRTIPPRYKHTAGVYNNCMIVAGGSTKEQIFDVWAFNFCASAWQNIAINVQLGQSGILHHNSLYVLGGSGQMKKWNLQKRQMIEFPQFGDAPQPRSFHSTVKAKGFLIVFGGNTGKEKLNEVNMLKLYCSEVLAMEILDLNDTKVTLRDGIIHTHFSLLKFRAPVLASLCESGREIQSYSTHFLRLDFQELTFRLLLNYVYKDEIYERVSLSELLQLYSVSCKLGVIPLVNRLSVYLMRNLTAENVSEIIEFLNEHSENRVLHRTEFQNNKTAFLSSCFDENIKRIVSNYDLKMTKTLFDACIQLICELRKSKVKLSKFVSDLCSTYVKRIENIQVPDNLVLSDYEECLVQLYSDDSTKECTLKTEEGGIKIHYFIVEKYLNGIKQLIKNNQVCLANANLSTLQYFVQYLYLGRKVLNSLPAEEILDMMSLNLDLIAPFKEVFGHYLMKRLNIEVAFKILKNQDKLFHLKDIAFSFLMKHFQDCVTSGEVLELDSSIIIEMLQWRARLKL